MGNGFLKWRTNLLNRGKDFLNGERNSQKGNGFLKWGMDFSNGNGFLKWETDFSNGELISELEN